MGNEKGQEIQFKMCGPSLDEGIPIHLISNALLDLQALLDKPYLYIERRDRISRQDRRNFHVTASSLRRGSFIADLDIIYQGAQLALPVVGAVGPQTIWEYTKETWRFIKLIFERAKSGDKPSIQTNDNAMTTVVYGNENYIFNGPVQMLAEKSLPHYKAFNSLVRNYDIDEIDIGSPIEPEIVLGEETQNLFKVPAVVQPEAIDLRCDFFDFNKYKSGGKLAVGSGQAIPPGQYHFTIVGAQNHIQYIYSMLQPEVSIKCLREEQVNPLGDTKIVRLHIITVAA